MFDFNKIKDMVVKTAVDQIPTDKLMSGLTSLIQSQPQEKVEKATEEAFDSLPQDQKTGLMDNVMGLMSKFGVTAQQAGVSSSDTSKMGGFDFAKIFSFITSSPDLL